MTIAYPADGPKPLRGSFNEDEIDTFVGDEGEVGSSRSRNRFTRSLRRFSFQSVLSEVQRVALREFYQTDLSRGVTPFDWTHPITGEVVRVKFQSYPKFKDRPVDRWKATITLKEI